MRFELTTFTLATCKHRMEVSQTQELTDAPPNACTNACTDDADPVHSDADLQQVIAAWPDLPEPLRAGILAMIQASKSAAPTG